MKNKLTEGCILKSLLALAVPIVFANLLQTAYQLTDTFWVGRLGTNAVASVSISFPLILLIISLGAGLAMAGTILVAQYKGKGDQKSINHITAQNFLMVLVISLVLAVAGYFATPILIKLMGANAEIIPDAISYMKISFIGMIFLYLFAVFESLMRGVGEVKKPMLIVLGTVLLNLILDPLFIFGYGIIPAFGVSGAAVATVVTQGLSALIGMIILFKGKYHIKIHLKDLKPDMKIIGKMVKLGLPASVEHSTRALGITIMTFLVTSFGTLTLASYGIGGRVLSFIIIPAIGLGIATSTLIGQNIGAGKMDRAEKIAKLSYKLGFVVLTSIGVLLFIFANQVANWFIPGELEAIESSALFIRIMALSFGFMGVQVSLNGVFRGSGSTKIAMILSLVSQWVLLFPVAYVLSKHTGLGELGIWIAFPVSNVLSAIITIIWFSKGTWKKKDITKEMKLENEVSEEVTIEEGN